MAIKNRSFQFTDFCATCFMPAGNFNAHVQGTAGIAAGDPVLAEVSTFGFPGYLIHDAGDEIGHFGTIFPELDKNYMIEITPVLSTTSTDTDAPVCKMTYSRFVVGTTVMAAPATTVTLGTFAMPGTAYVLTELATWYQFAPRVFYDEDIYSFVIEVDALGSASSDELSFMGIKYRGRPNITRQAGV